MTGDMNSGSTTLC